MFRDGRQSGSGRWSRPTVEWAPARQDHSLGMVVNAGEAVRNWQECIDPGFVLIMNVRLQQKVDSWQAWQEGNNPGRQGRRRHAAIHRTWVGRIISVPSNTAAK